jgi:ubiquinone/menaquinone biosynthesis C-methylase UbiE
MNDFNKTEASSFNKIASVYDEVRPGYPEEVYSTISQYVNYNKYSKLLEIGAGQGIATEEIYKKWQSSITAIEPGIHLYNMMDKKFKDISQINIINTTFEEFNTNTQYDGIFSATAFHWIDSKVKYKNAHDLLKDNSFIFLYWNNYGISNGELENQIRQIYTKYGFPKSKATSDEIRNDKIEKRKNEIIQSGLFSLIEHKVINTSKRYDVKSYIKLLQTFPDHSKEKIPSIDNMFKDIEDIILAKNDYIDVKVVVNLEIAKKILTTAST